MTSHTLLVAERELRERRFVFIAAAVAALIPYMAFFLPGVKSVSRADLGNIGAIMAVIFTAALALIVGGSVVGRESAERRLSFYFNRPLPASSIWFGKLLAAIILVGISFAIIAVPSVLISGSSLLWQDDEDWYVGAALFAALLAFILIGHVASTMVRSRSPRVVIDLVLVIVTGILGWLIIRPLMAAFAFNAAGYTAVAVLIGAIIAAIAAGAWQISRGRSDARRSHAALQTFLWPAIGVALLIGAAATGWILSAKPSDIVFANAGQVTPQWFYLHGKARGRADYKPLFLINGQTGEPVRISNPVQNVTSRDGRTLGFVTSTSFNRTGGPFEMRLMQLGEGSRELVGTSIDVRPTDRTVLSDDGRLLAVLRRPVVSVHDLKDKRLIVSARLPEPSTRFPSYRMVFSSPQAMRIYELPEGHNEPTLGTLRAFDLDLGARRLVLIGTMQTEARSVFVTANDDASRLIVGQWKGPNASTVRTIIDGRTLQPVSSLGSDARPFRGVSFLQGGRIAAMNRDGEQRRLLILSPSGEVLSTTELPAGAYSFIVGEAAGNLLVIGESRPNKARPDSHDYAASVIDLQTGKILRREQPFYPVLGGGHWEADPRQDAVTADRVWLLRNKNQIWRWDPATGAKTLVVRMAESPQT